MFSHTLSEVTNWDRYIKHVNMSEHRNTMQPFTTGKCDRHCQIFLTVYEHIDDRNASNYSLELEDYSCTAEGRRFLGPYSIRRS